MPSLVATMSALARTRSHQNQNVLTIQHHIIEQTLPNTEWIKIKYNFPSFYLSVLFLYYFKFIPSVKLVFKFNFNLKFSRYKYSEDMAQ